MSISARSLSASALVVGSLLLAAPAHADVTKSTDPQDSVDGADIRAVRIDQRHGGRHDGKVSLQVQIEGLSRETTVRWVFGSTVKFTAWRTRSGKTRLEARHLFEGEPKFWCPQAIVKWSSTAATLHYDRRCDATVGTADPSTYYAGAMKVAAYTFLPSGYEYYDAAQAPKLTRWTGPTGE